MTSKTFLQELSETIKKEGLCLINDFFITFSRFECSLKVSGYAIGDNKKVNPNWDKFITSIRKDFEEKEQTDSVKKAIEYLLNNPPKVQNLENEKLDWRDRIFEINTPLINKLSLSIRDIRNNLFHGGKFNGNYEEDVSRNSLLLKYSIEVLNYWLELSPKVKENFMEPIK